MIDRKKEKPKLILALDVNSLGEVRTIMSKVDKHIDLYKVGSQLFTACGPAAVRYIEAHGKQVFLDLKFHDIPNTVYNAVEASVALSVALERSTDFYRRKQAKKLGLLMLTVHTQGGVPMMQAAVQASTKAAEKNGITRPLVVGITVLTSEEKKDNIQPLVLERAAMAQEAGLDGVVASCNESSAIRHKFGKDFIIVTPGIRPEGSDPGDQRRTATPQEAVRNGSDFLVIGRPILKAKDPAAVIQKILEDMESV